MEIRKTKCVDNEKPLMSIFALYFTVTYVSDTQYMQIDLDSA